MASRTVPFLAIILTAIALIPGGAHLLVLPNKIGLDRDAYFTVQQIYAGWWMLGLVLFAVLIVDAVLAFRLRGNQPAFAVTLIALLLIAANLVIFFTWTFPPNQATANWTEVPENWEALRRQWEYSHAINAVITFVSLCCITLANLTTRD